MKLIILFLISFTAMAQTKVSIIPNDSKLASMSFEKDNLAKAKNHLRKIVRKSQWLKGKYKKGKPSKGLTFTKKDMDGKTLYFHPSNFMALDTTAKAKKEKDKKEKKLKPKKDLIEILRIKDLNIKQINKLLREIYR